MLLLFTRLTKQAPYHLGVCASPIRVRAQKGGDILICSCQQFEYDDTHSYMTLKKDNERLIVKTSNIAMPPTNVIRKFSHVHNSEPGLVDLMAINSYMSVPSPK